MSTIVEFYIPESDRNKSITILTKNNIFDKKHAVVIEQGLYDFTKQYCLNNYNDTNIYKAVYLDKVRDLIFNCEQDNATMYDIKNKIKKDKYNCYNLAFLTPAEMNTVTWEKIIKRKLVSEEMINNLPKITWKPCRDCKSVKYSRYQLQTRSADEPITTFYICADCKRTYKVNQ